LSIHSALTANAASLTAVNPYRTSTYERYDKNNNISRTKNEFFLAHDISVLFIKLFEKRINYSYSSFVNDQHQNISALISFHTLTLL
jgi:hypothetical protein